MTKICPRRRGFKSSLAHHWSKIFLENRHQYQTPIETSEAMRILYIRHVISSCDTFHKENHFARLVI
jgi:hypothetical protein